MNNVANLDRKIHTLLSFFSDKLSKKTPFFSNLGPRYFLKIYPFLRETMDTRARYKFILNAPAGTVIYLFYVTRDLRTGTEYLVKHQWLLGGCCCSEFHRGPESLQICFINPCFCMMFLHGALWTPLL